MYMTSWEKFRAIVGGASRLSEIKTLLARRFWEQYPRFVLDFAGVQAVFSTEDFYSNYWFYGPQNEFRVYEPAVTRLLVKLARGCRCFADIGANLGYFTTVAFAANKNASLFAFEMDETLSQIIKRNLELNGCKTASVVSAAIGDVDGREVAYTPHPFSFIAEATGIRLEPFEIKLMAKTISLDTYFSDRPILPDLIKMDVDGAEMLALRGMGRLLAQPDLQMLLEIHSHHLPNFGTNADAVLKLVRDLGFKTYRLVNFRHDDDVELFEINDARQLIAPTGDMILVTRKTPN
jgi:FkbM family methyltransferase